jgi:hypothetical protein
VQDIEPTDPIYLPDGQEAHDDAEAALAYLPRGQALQVEPPPASLNLPTVQEAHDVEETTL